MKSKYNVQLIKYFPLILLFIVFVSGCSKQDERIVKMSDIKSYLMVENNKNSFELQRTNLNINFWSGRLAEDPANSIFKQTLSGLYANRFRLSGNIDDLLKADTLLLQANKEYHGKDVSILQSLSQNAISRHQFRLALQYAELAYNLPEDRENSKLVLIDALMETGNYAGAENLLAAFTEEGKSSFSYLVRASRFMQYKGNLDSAVALVKQANSLASKSSNNAMLCYTDNLAATYLIESNKPEEAYSFFIDALRNNPNYTPALEGIAAISFLFDKDPETSKNIYESLSQSLSSPDPYLNLYKIAKYNNDSKKKDEYLKTFLAKAGDIRYGRMYNKYIANIESEEFKNFDKAKQIAESEINERPTPQTYFLLAWAYFQNGNLDSSIEIIKKQVEGKTSDPDILAKIDRIYLEQTKKM